MESGSKTSAQRRSGRRATEAASCDRPSELAAGSFSKAELGAVPRLGRNEGGDARDRPEVIDLKIFQRNLKAKLLLQLRQELDQHERVHQPGVDQVRVERWDPNVPLLREQGGDLVR